MAEPMTEEAVRQFVLDNWDYFSQTWQTVSPAIRHYISKPEELTAEQVGLTWFRAQHHERTTQNTRSEDMLDQKSSQTINQIRYWYNRGVTDPADISYQIGPVVFDGQPPSPLAYSSVQAILSGTPPKFLKDFTGSFGKVL